MLEMSSARTYTPQEWGTSNSKKRGCVFKGFSSNKETTSLLPGNKEQEDELPQRRPRKQAPSSKQKKLNPLEEENVTTEDDDPVKVYRRRMSMSEAVHDYTCPNKVLDFTQGGTNGSASVSEDGGGGSSDDGDKLGTYRSLRDETGNRIAWHDEVSVNMKRTIKMFFYHTFYPISLPFMAWFEGLDFLKSTEFLHLHVPHILTVHVFPLVLIFLNIVILGKFVDGYWQDIMAAEVLMVDFYYVFRIVIISIKYGYMPKDEYRYISKGPAYKGREVNRRSMLLTGWIDPSCANLRLELKQAEARTGLWLKDTAISCSCELLQILPDVLSCPDDGSAEPEEMGNSVKNPIIRNEKDQHQFWESLPHGVKKNLECADGSVLVDPEQLAVAIWYRHKSPVGKRLISLALSVLVFIFRVGSPILVAYMDDEFRGPSFEDKFDTSVMVLLIICGYLLQHTMLIFVVIAVLDYSRRYETASCLTTLTRPTRVRLRREGGKGKELKENDSGMLTVNVWGQSQCSAAGSVSWFPPLLDVCWPENVYSWYRLREIMRDIGYRFQLRLQLYLGIMASLLIVLNIVIVIQLFEEGQDEFFDNNRNRTFFLENAFVTVFFMACIATIIILGSLANGELSKQEDTLLQAVLKLEQLARRFSVEKKFGMQREAESCIRTLRAVREVVRIRDTANPVKVLGLQASPALLQAVVTGSATLIATVSNKLRQRSTTLN
eukprot:gb/GECG01010266.1/.p1 GENE.gb/GECG01010266.1/~~gb/GECG01010266.1/.p1  ORF type:complete len:719 (+),score=76.49 gb/GECG01010266.1/:1-2157(+)